jgi:hypothetical protein
LAGPPDENIQQVLCEVVQPATFAQLAAYRACGLRERILTLPVMVAFVLSLLWRQMGSVQDAVRVLHREGFLWTSPLRVTQQAVSERLRNLPAELFENIWRAVLPRMQERAEARKRPLPGPVARALKHFRRVLILDGSTLDALVKKVGLLRDLPKNPLAGRMAALLNAASRLPEQVWYEEESTAHDQRFWERTVQAIEAGCLLLFDLGFTNFGYFDRLTDQGVFFVTRAKSNLRFTVQATLLQTPQALDQVVQTAGAQPLRLVQVLYRGRWYRYLTNVLDPAVLSAEDVVGLYWQRWRIEDAYHIAKRLLGLSYFHVGSINGVQVQLWCTWLLYAVLIDLADAVAEKLLRPLADISIEMVFRSLYHYTQARQRGETRDIVAYLADPANRDLGILKQKRRTDSSGFTLLTNSSTA